MEWPIGLPSTACILPTLSGDGAGVVQRRQERVRGTANIGCDDEQSGSPEHNWSWRIETLNGCRGSAMSRPCSSSTPIMDELAGHAKQTCRLGSAAGSRM